MIPRARVRRQTRARRSTTDKVALAERGEPADVRRAAVSKFESGCAIRHRCSERARAAMGGGGENAPSEGRRRLLVASRRAGTGRCEDRADA